jgi:hypothetical protein
MGVRGAARPTKADVARLANVSPATVTYVLNDVAGQTISAQTKAAVQSAAKELGYRPNLAARNLAVGGSGVMLYVVPRISLGELLLEVGSRLTTALARHGVVLSLQFETDDGRNVVDAVASLNPIAVTSVFPLGGAALEAVTAAHIPQIHLGSAQLHAMGTLHLTIGGRSTCPMRCCRRRPPSAAGTAFPRSSRDGEPRQDWDEITPEWTTAALAGHHPDATVEKVTVDLRDDGTNRRARLGVTYSAGSGPATVFVKAVDPDHRAMIEMTSGLLHEPRLFEPKVVLPLEHPFGLRGPDRRGGTTSSWSWRT